MSSAGPERRSARRSPPPGPVPLLLISTNALLQLSRWSYGCVRPAPDGYEVSLLDRDGPHAQVWIHGSAARKYFQTVCGLNKLSGRVGQCTRRAIAPAWFSRFLLCNPVCNSVRLVVHPGRWKVPGRSIRGGDGCAFRPARESTGGRTRRPSPAGASTQEPGASPRHRGTATVAGSTRYCGAGARPRLRSEAGMEDPCLYQAWWAIGG